MKLLIQMMVAGVAASTLACIGNGAGNGNAANNGVGTVGDAGEVSPQRAMLTGCLLAGGDAGSYVLQLPSAGDVATTGPADAVPTHANEWAAGRTFRVVATGLDLAQHLNQRVAMEGYIEPGLTDTIGTSGTEDQGSATDRAGRNDDGKAPGSGAAAAAEMQTFRADSVNKVADRCLPGTPQGELK